MADRLECGSRTFEALYLLWGYLAAAGAVAFGVTGRSPAAFVAQPPVVYFGLAVALLGAVIAGRRLSRG